MATDTFYGELFVSTPGRIGRQAREDCYDAGCETETRLAAVLSFGVSAANIVYKTILSFAAINNFAARTFLCKCPLDVRAAGTTTHKF